MSGRGGVNVEMGTDYGATKGVCIETARWVQYGWYFSVVEVWGSRMLCARRPLLAHLNYQSMVRID